MSTKPLLCSVVTILAFAISQRATAQDGGNVEELQKQVEILKKENELLKKEVELLKKELEAKDEEHNEKPEVVKKGRSRGPSLSDLLTEGKVLSGTYRESMGVGRGDITFSISERNGNKIKGTASMRHIDNATNRETTSTAEAEGVINGSRFSWVTVGSANRHQATTTLVRGVALEGTYKTVGGQVGTVAFKLD